MQLAVPQILGAFADDGHVRVVVMAGAGDRAFVSGADISEFEQRRSDPGVDQGIRRGGGTRGRRPTAR